MMEQQKTVGNRRPWVFGQINQFIWTFLPEFFHGRFPVGLQQYVINRPHGRWKNVPCGPLMMYSQKSLQEPLVVDIRQNVNFEQILTSKNQSKATAHFSIAPSLTSHTVCTVWSVNNVQLETRPGWFPATLPNLKAFSAYIQSIFLAEIPAGMRLYIIDGPHGRWVRI